MKFIFFLLIAMSSVYARAGGETGGGQDTVAAFNGNVMTLTRWLEDNGSKLNPPVNARQFFLAADPGHVIPINDKADGLTSKYQFRAVTEKCDGVTPKDYSNLRTACYNQHLDNVYLSEARYPLESSPSALGVTAHEVFRRMNLEGDGYQVSRQIDIARMADNPTDIDLLASARKLFEQADPLELASIPNELVLLDLWDKPAIGTYLDQDSRPFFGSFIYINQKGILPRAYAGYYTAFDLTGSTTPYEIPTHDFDALLNQCKSSLSFDLCFAHIPKVFTLLDASNRASLLTYVGTDLITVIPNVANSTLSDNNGDASGRYTFRRKGNSILVKVELLDKYNVWHEAAYYFADITRDRMQTSGL